MRRIAVALVVVAACGGGGDDSGGGPDAARVADAGAPDAVHVAECVRTCGVPADCVPPGATPDRDADNWACDSGACRWLGCKSNAECPTGETCGYFAVAPTCWTQCAAPADCAIGATITSADNWTCSAGACTWLGCIADDECQAEYGAGYHCLSTFGFPGCYQTCTTAAECGASEVCVLGACLYQCASATTCQVDQPLGPGTYDCR